MTFGVKIYICAFINHNKFYSSFHYMLQVSVVLTILSHLNT